MSGRAGRKGHDKLGESVILCKPSEQAAVTELLHSTLSPLESCLTEAKRGMARPLMEVIANGVVETVYDIERFVRCTLFAAQHPYEEVHSVSKIALRFLQDNDFIEWNTKHQKFLATKLGKATTSSALSPEEGLVRTQLITLIHRSCRLPSKN